MPSNTETAKRGYEFFLRGDVPGLVREIIHDDCTWIGAGPKDKLPWAGHFNGKQGVANFFSVVAQHLHFTKFAPHEYVEQGETVVVIGTSSAQVKSTGKSVDNEWVHVVKFRQGKLIFWQEYTDTDAEVLGMS
jgi:ketosteroid isomerase-like protein